MGITGLMTLTISTYKGGCTLCRSKKYLKNELQDSTELAEQLKKIYLEKNPAKQLLLFNMEK